MDLKIFSGRSNEPLARAIVAHIPPKKYPKSLTTTLGGRTSVVHSGNVALGALDDKRGFPDGEVYVRYGENLRGCDVFVVQSTNQPHENDEELRMMVDTARLASAERVTAVVPYFGYARQDRKDKSRAPISAVRKVKELVACGVDRLLVLDVHSSAVEIAAAALNTPCDHLWARPVFIKFMKDNPDFSEFMKEGLVVAAPDFNAGKFARGYAESIWEKLGVNVPIVLVEKRRDPSTGKTEVINVIGNVRRKNVLLVDDMIDTAGTICDAESALLDRGARRIWAIATHAVFSGEAYKRLSFESQIERIFVTDSIARYEPELSPKISKVSVAPLLGEAIFRIHTNKSVSELFE